MTVDWKWVGVGRTKKTIRNIIYKEKANKNGFQKKSKWSQRAGGKGENGGKNP